MNSAQRIAETLDRHLTEKTEIVVFGAAAVLLDPVYAQHLENRRTQDVDIIIPAQREMQVDSDPNFWRAIENTNQELKNEGLYISHIFPEREVTLTPEWQRYAVQLETPNLAKLKMSRPRVLDLVISKMGRGDAQDIEDVKNLLRLEHKITGKIFSAADVREASERANVPAAYREIFPAARERIIAAVAAGEQSRRV